MNANDLMIGENEEAYVITAVGRANFEYAVPIRELVNSNEGRKTVRVDLKECLAMDSTFMGVLSMGGKSLKRPISIKAFILEDSSIRNKIWHN